jgi:hypothetical protein
LTHKTLAEALRFEARTIGQIASLGSLNTGADYNTPPFVTVMDEPVYGYNRQDFFIQTDVPDRAFVIGEQLEQPVALDGATITYNVGGNTAPFQVGEGITQTGATIKAQVVSANTSTVKVRVYEGTFTGLTNIKSSSSLNTFTATNIANAPINTTAKGRVKSIQGQLMEIQRMSFNVPFQTGVVVTGKTSTATAQILYSYENLESPILGYNAIVDSEARTVNGSLVSLEIVDSGFAYADKQEINLVNQRTGYEMDGIVNLQTSGKKEGYFESTDGFLNSDKYLHDGEYYQEFSYEIRTSVALERYADVFRNLVHVAGTTFFNRITKSSHVTTELTSNSAVVIS